MERLTKDGLARSEEHCTNGSNAVSMRLAGQDDGSLQRRQPKPRNRPVVEWIAGLQDGRIRVLVRNFSLS